MDVVAHAQAHRVAHAVARDDLVEGLHQGQADGGFGVGGDVLQLHGHPAARIGDVLHVGLDLDEGRAFAGPAEEDVVAFQRLAGDGVLALGLDDGDGVGGGLDGPDAAAGGGVVGQGFVEQVFLVAGDGGGRAGGCPGVLIEQLFGQHQVIKGARFTTA